MLSPYVAIHRIDLSRKIEVIPGMRMTFLNIPGLDTGSLAGSDHCRLPRSRPYPDRTIIIFKNSRYFRDKTLSPGM